MFCRTVVLDEYFETRTNFVITKVSHTKSLGLVPMYCTNGIC